MKDYYVPQEHEREAAAQSYLMSLLVVMVGLPFPIVNLAATLIFYLANRRKTYFVRWHCTQALVSQVPLFLVNCVLFWWSVRILLDMIERRAGNRSLVLESTLRAGASVR